jgi:N-acetylglutamate synthase-like GNAT family acetyltransferase
MLSTDARPFLEVIHASVRGLAATHYPIEVIQAWAPLEITEKAVAGFLVNPDNELRLVAEQGGEIVGIGAIVPNQFELRACYVSPRSARKGVGTTLVHEMERMAREHNLRSLHADASLNAEGFYKALGYEVLARADHVLRPSGVHMACVKIRKALDSGRSTFETSAH